MKAATSSTILNDWQSATQKLIRANLHFCSQGADLFV
jgi:hypothetical protein